MEPPTDNLQESDLNSAENCSQSESESADEIQEDESLPAAGDATNWLWLLTGPLVLPIAILPVIYWMNASHVGFRWFLAGAVVWCVGVGLKVVCAGATYFFMKSCVEPIPVRPGRRLLIGSFYLGVLTGIFEVGTTYAAARIWTSWAQGPERAVAIGLGAGSWEAFLMAGVPMAWASLIALLSPAHRMGILSGLCSQRTATIAPWLIIPVERVLATLGHISFRMLPLYAIATGQIIYFWYGFLLATGFDAFAGWFQLSGREGRVSHWWTTLAYATFALASIVIINWCYRHWPS